VSSTCLWTNSPTCEDDCLVIADNFERTIALSEPSNKIYALLRMQSNVREKAQRAYLVRHEPRLKCGLSFLESGSDAFGPLL
jgi:hypothetical protein